MLMLTDNPPEFDRRVLSALAEHGGPPLIVIPRRTLRIWRYASAALALAWLPCLWLRYGRALAGLGARLGGNYGAAFAGLRAGLLLQAASMQFLWTHRRQLRESGALYAHDQMAGVVARVALFAWGVPYIYDAHEIVPFRARQTGPARMLLEYGWERAIVRSAQRCCVVNVPMRRLYQRLYGVVDYHVRPNDFFAERTPELEPAATRLLIYIGALGAQRGLEAMSAFAAARGARQLCFASNLRQGEAGPTGAEVHGIEGYEEVLVGRVTGSAPYLWCAFDTSVLSYRYSLPNKFFQAMALGIPIIAVRGSYLGRLVERHGIGVLIGQEAGDAVDPWAGETFMRCARAMLAFRRAYRSGELSVP